jgi:hypothetical protein
MKKRYPYPTSFYIDLETKTECKALAAAMSLSESSVVRWLIRREYAAKIGSKKIEVTAAEQVTA